MHELSIAQSLVEVVQEHLPADATRVTVVHLRLGRLAGVVQGALEFCYELATQETKLAGSTLHVIDLPVVVHCGPCDREVALAGELSFVCPACGTPTGDIRQGRELEIASIEYDSAGEGEP